MQAGTIALILNIVFVAILILGFLIGMWRGVKKASVNIVFAIIGVIVAFFCCAHLTNTIVSINITVNGQTSTISEFLTALFRDNPDIARLIETTPSIEALIVNLPYAICNAIVFIVLTLAVEFVMYILYKIFAAIFVKKKDKEGNKLPKRRIAGGAVGLIKTAVLMLFVLMPFVSLVGTASDLTNTSNDIYAEEVEEGNSADGMLGSVMPDVALQVIDGFNTSAFGVLGNMFGLDNVMFDYLSAFKLDDQTIYIRQEIENYNNIYSTGMQLKLIFEGKTDKKFTDINFDKLDGTIDALLNSVIYKNIVSSVLDDVIVHYDEYSFITPESFGDYFVVFEDISNAVASYVGGAGEYLAHDLRNLYEAYKTLATSGALDKAISGQNAGDVLSIISTENFEELEKGIYSILTTNIVKDSTANIIDLLVSKVLEGSESVVVDGRALTDEDFKELATSIANVVKDFSNISKDVDLMSMLDKPLDLLANSNQVNIESVFNSLGALIDDIKAIKLFQTADGSSIIDKFLSDNNFVLPVDEVINSKGQSVKLSTYSEYMKFISPALASLKSINVYDLMNADVVSTSDILIAFANACKNDEDILSDIILPLYQVEPTKTLLVKNLLTTLDKTIIDFSEETLANYDDWKSDLGYISKLLTTLNKGAVDGKTYLQVMFDQGADKLFVSLGDDITVTDIMKPMFYAKSTNGLKQKLFDTFESVFNNLVFDGGASSIKFDFTKVTLIENNPEDQNAEICKVFEKFVGFYGDYDKNTTKLEDLDKIKLGEFLDAMKENAYRKTLASKGEDGLFKFGFANLIEKVKGVYPQLNSVTDYANTNFTQLFTELANAE